MTISEKSILIKQKALELGFAAVGFAAAGELTKEKEFLRIWLDEGLHASMHYMENYFDKRVNPQVLVPGAKTVISLALNYFPGELQHDESAPVLSKYAYGIDYHFVLKDKLKSLFGYINSAIQPVEGRGFVDSAPVLDRAWAARAGLGWIGKNTNLIIPRTGSFVFIGELIIDLELEYDKPINERCGSCTRCILACPTNALIKPYVLDSNRCISFLTIENKDAIPETYKGKLEDRVYGCDICQDVCPWNRNHEATTETAFTPSKRLLGLSLQEWREMDETTFRELFKKSAVKRAKFQGLKRNIDFISRQGEEAGE